MLIAVALIVLALAAFAQDDPTRWVSGTLLMEIEETEFGDPIIDEDGFVTTGWPEIDAAFRVIGVDRWRRLIPIAPNPEYRRRWRWVERWFKVYFDEEKIDVPSAMELLHGAKGITIMEPDFVYVQCATPNDPFYWSHQWYARKIQADRVWDFTQGEPTIIMGACDSGVDYLHEDLTNLMWQNLGEDLNDNGYVFIPGVGFDPGDVQQDWTLPPDSSFDLDGNGYIDDFIGYDFVDGVFTDAYRHPTDPTIREDGLDFDNDPMDFRYNGHGTHCTGIMTAEANNNVGIAGITWRTQIMALRTGYYSRDCRGYNQNAAVIQALHYGTMMGCKVFNFSYGGRDSSHFVHSLIDTAVNSWGVLITAAAGNDNTDELHYPSAYPEVIAVAATGPSDRKAGFSNFSTTVDISAPGEDMGSTVPRFYERPPAPCDGSWWSNFAPGYASFDGTSMAAPVVAGAAGLLWSFFPDSSNHWIRQRLEDWADYIYDVPGNASYAAGEQLGSGRVNAFRALAAGIFPSLSLVDVELIDENGNGRPEPDERVELFFTYENSADPTWAPATGAQIKVTTKDTLVIILDSIATIGSIPNGATNSNAGNPIVFKMDPTHRYGRFVSFKIELTTPDRYVHIANFRTMVGYPEVLVASIDTTFDYINKVMGSLRWGGVPFDSVFVPTTGLPREIMDRHRVIIYMTGDESGHRVLPGSSEADMEGWLSAEAGRLLMLTGQHMPQMATPAWLERVFGTRHVEDVVPLALAMNIKGLDGDIIGDGFEDNIAFGGGSALNQRYTGSCSAVGGGIPFLYYNAGELPDSTCGVRYESPEGWKSILLEFGIEGFSDSLRHSFLERALAWADVPYFWDVPEEAVRPYSMKLLSPYPNPFNSAVILGFDIPEPAPVEIDIFDVNGRLVRNFSLPSAKAGPNLIRWNATLENGEFLPTGTYLYRVTSGGEQAGGKIVYMK